jgi:hypothetical protein
MPVALALALLLTPSLLTSPITLKHTGRVTDFLAQISQQSETKLTVGKKEGAEILIVALDKAPLDETMERIAWATYGKWEREKDGYRLVRDVVAEREAEKAYVAASVGTARQAIARFREQVQELKPSDRQVNLAAVPGRIVRRPLPIPAAEARLLARLLDGLPVEPLVSLRSVEDVTVFSNLPTPTQRPLGAGATKALRDYVAEANGLQVPARIVLRGVASPSGGGIAMTLYTTEGMTAHSGLAVYLPFSIEPKIAVPKEILDTVPADMEVPLSPISKAFRRPPADPEYGSMASRQEWRAVPDFMARLREPEKYEPLATFATDLWTATAAQSGRNLIMNVDDQHLVPTSMGKPLPMRAYLTIPSPDEIKVTPGWMVGRPPLLNSPWGHRVDRTALGRYVRCPYPDRSLGQLEAGADFVKNAGTPVISYAVAGYIPWASQGNLTSDGSGGWRLERFYASLPEVTRRAWLSGRPVSVASLSAPAKIALTRWITGGGYGTFWEPKRPISEMARMEETVRFPYGFATGGWLRADLKEEDGFVARIPDGEGGMGERWDSVKSLAQLLNAMLSQSDEVQIHEAMQQSLRLYAELDDDPAVPERTLTHYVVQPSKFVRWKQARPEVVEAIWRARRGG